VPALRAGIVRRMRGHIALMEEQLSPSGWLLDAGPTLIDLYLAACLRWARLYPTGAPLLPDLGPSPRLEAILEALETRPAVVRAFAAEYITGRSLTAPTMPDLPAAEVTG